MWQPEEPSTSKEDASSNAEQQSVEPVNKKESTDKKSTKKKEVDPCIDA